MKTNKKYRKNGKMKCKRERQMLMSQFKREMLKKLKNKGCSMIMNYSFKKS